MEALMTSLTVSMSEFKKNPSKIVREAGNKPVAVLNHNKASFYILEPQVYEALLEELFDIHVTPLIEERRLHREEAVTVDIETI